MSEGSGLTRETKDHCLKRYKSLKSSCKDKSGKSFFPGAKIKTIKETQMKFLVGSKAVNYKKADKNCRRAGYQLAKVTNKDENKKLEEIIG